jgi:hypothetical protein
MYMSTLRVSKGTYTGKDEHDVIPRIGAQMRRN